MMSYFRSLRLCLAFFSLAFFIECAQSTIVLDPVVNKPVVASTTPIEGTLTVNVNLTAQGANHQNQQFSTLLVQNGVLVAALMYSGASATDGAGQASVVMNTVDTNKCMVVATPAVLLNGSYDLYFAINYGSQAATIVATTICGLPGVLESLPGNLYAARGQVVISGDTTYSITDSNVALAVQHSFQFTATTPATRAFICWLTDPNATTNIGNHVIAGYNGTTDGSGNVTVNSGFTVIPLLALGTYKYFCYLNANNDGTTGNSGDKVASGFATVTGAGTTVVAGTDFTAIP